MLTGALTIEAPAVVSISGVSGSGKTALAREAVRGLEERAGWEIAWVDLHDATTAADTVARVARALVVDGLDEEILGMALRFRRVVVVLDAADTIEEHLRGVIDALLPFPTARVVVTTVRPLSGPDVVTIPLAGLAEPDAVDLFAAAAAMARPNWLSDTPSREEVASLCLTLSGLPLAIILAAARIARPEAGRDRLLRLLQDDPNFGLVLAARSDRDNPARGDSVRGALSWTYTLLDPEDQRVFRRISVFAGPFGLEAAAHVCERSKYDLLVNLEQLAGLRLLEPGRETAGVATFQLPGLFKAYAAEALTTVEEHEATAALHASWFANVAGEAARLRDDGYGGLARHRLTAVEADLFSALTFLEASGDVRAALRLAANLHPLGAEGGAADLCARVAELLAASSSDLDRATRADALLCLAELGADSMAGPDTIPLTRRQWREGIELARAEGEPLRVLRGLAGAVLTLPVTQDFAGAADAAVEGRALAEEIGHVRWQGRFTAWMGMVHHQMADFAGAARCAEEALGIGLRASDQRTIILVGLLTSNMPKEHLPSLPLLPQHEELYSMAVDLEDLDAQSWLIGQLAGHANRRGDFEGGAAWTVRRLKLVSGSKAWHGLGFSLMTSVAAAAGLGESRVAARTHGALAPILPTLLAALAPDDAAYYQSVLTELRRRLGDSAFDEEVRAGARVRWPEAVDAVLPVLLAASDGRSAPARAQALTPRELDVLRLLAEGLSNKEIATRLGVSQKTAMHHSMAIYRKLEVRGRSEATAVAMKLGLVPI
jgi:non-specific serine/threonine protein kinase